MNRRKFLGYCAAAGMTMGLSGLASYLEAEGSISPEDMAELSGLRIADAHAHPYQLHGSRNYDGTTPSIEMMNKVGMVASSFSAVGDRVKYSGMSGMPFRNTLNQLISVSKSQE